MVIALLKTPVVNCLKTIFLIIEKYLGYQIHCLLKNMRFELIVFWG